MSTVVVIGASRGVGARTVQAALAAGHDVRAIARSAGPATGGPVGTGRLTRIAASALDAVAVDAAIKGADAVILTLGSNQLLSGTTLFSSATRIAIEAMRRHGVRRLIAVTGMGAGDSRYAGGPLYNHLFFPLLLSRIYADKDVQERIIRTSGLDWVIVRPGILTNGPATGRVRALTDPRDWKGGSISRADVAAFLVAQVTGTGYLGKTPLLVS